MSIDGVGNNMPQNQSRYQIPEVCTVLKSLFLARFFIDLRRRLASVARANINKCSKIEHCNGQREVVYLNLEK